MDRTMSGIRTVGPMSRFFTNSPDADTYNNAVDRSVWLKGTCSGSHGRTISITVLPEDILTTILSNVPMGERLFSAMVSTEWHSVMKSVEKKEPDPRKLGDKMSKKLFFTPIRSMFSTPAHIDTLNEISTAAFKYFCNPTNEYNQCSISDTNTNQWWLHESTAMQMLVEYCPWTLSFSEACQYLKDNMSKFNIVPSIFDNEGLMNAAVKGGNVEMVNVLQSLGLMFDDYHARIAIRHNRLSVLRGLMSLVRRMNPLLYAAAEEPTRKMQVLNFIYDRADMMEQSRFVTEIVDFSEDVELKAWAESKLEQL
jgi:hypothetical protein